MWDVGGNAGGAVEARKRRWIFLGKFGKFLGKTDISFKNEEKNQKIREIFSNNSENLLEISRNSFGIFQKVQNFYDFP